MKVLIIEDDKFIAEALVTKFKNNGLDIRLPGKDGFEILKDLKKDDKTKNIPVVIVSNLGSKEDLEKGKQLGAAGSMIKATVTPEEIVEKAKEVMAKITTENR